MRYLYRPQYLLLGMNPGPWGMAQTGVPFGEINAVRDWMKLEAPIGQPDSLNPKRPITGFSTNRSEVSGARLWGWAQKRYNKPEAFFNDFFVINYCPLVFMEQSGKNRTPDKLPATESAPLYEACDQALVACINLIQPSYLIGVGAFAHKCLQRVQRDRLQSPENYRVEKILHPSPASPIANRGWAAASEKQLLAMGVKLCTA